MFLPWVTLPHPITVGGTQFMPIDTNDPAPVVGSEIGDAVRQALRLYVDLGGNPIESCTILLRPRHQQRWDIPDELWSQARRSTEMLALSCMAEHRFLEGHFSRHLNASMFQLMGHGIKAGSSSITLHFPRRGNGLRLYTSMSNVEFQQPRQIEGTRCEIIGTRLAKALTEAYRTKSSVWVPISSSLEFFFLGHSETQELGWDSCIMLSAMAFERLLESGQGAQALAQAFSSLWAPYTARTIADAKRVDPDPAYASDQQNWPIHRKWMKEVYELRNSTAHRGAQSGFSRNWGDWQHIIIAGFAFPFAVKLKLAGAGLYTLNAREIGACQALDRLLDSNWRKGKEKEPEWSEILSLSEAAAELESLTDQRRSTATSRTKQQSRINKAPKRAGYD